MDDKDFKIGDVVKIKGFPLDGVIISINNFTKIAFVSIEGVNHYLNYCALEKASQFKIGDTIKVDKSMWWLFGNRYADPGLGVIVGTTTVMNRVCINGIYHNIQSHYLEKVGGSEEDEKCFHEFNLSVELKNLAFKIDIALRDGDEDMFLKYARQYNEISKALDKEAEKC